MTSPVSMPAGHEIVAEDLDAYEALTAVWTTYAPTLTGSVTNPTNYTATGKYTRHGPLILFQFSITAAASFTAGSGDYSISVPVTGIVTAITAGSARFYDSSTGNGHTGVRLALTTTTTLGLQITTTFGGTLSNVGAAIPWTWATGDIMDGFIIYEAA